MPAGAIQPSWKTSTNLFDRHSLLPAKPNKVCDALKEKHSDVVGQWLYGSVILVLRDTVEVPVGAKENLTVGNGWRRVARLAQVVHGQ